MRIRSWGQALLVFALAAAWGALFLPWNGFMDPDAFYHAKASALLWSHGPLYVFPWLDLTLLGSSFADLHFGFHAFVAPFTSVFGMFQGLRIASVLLIGMFAATSYMSFRLLRIRYPALWTALLLASPALLFRLVLAKATPLALALFMAGLAAAWLRRPFILTLISVAYALCYGGWIYLLGSVVLLAFGDALYTFFIEEKKYLERIRSSLWKEILSVSVGSGLGMILHPNFPAIFQMWWTQIVTIGLRTPYAHVNLGMEWLPSTFPSFISAYAFLIIIGITGCAGLMIAPRKPLDEQRARMVIAFGIVIAGLFALTLKSQRNTEYLGPVVVLWCGALWSLINVRVFWKEMEHTCSRYGRYGFVAITCIVSGCVATIFLQGISILWLGSHPPRYSEDTYRKTMSSITSRAAFGDRVFHSDWTEFPFLIAADDRLRYVSGLDPTFLYAVDPGLSDEVKDVTFGAVTTTRERAWSLIHDRLQSKFIFASIRNHAMFISVIRSDQRYRLLAEDDMSIAWEVLP